MEKKRVLFIVNPASGPRHNSAEEFASLVSEFVDRSILDFQIEITQYARHASELSKKAVENKVDIVVAVGGDGTLNEVACELINTDTVLGIIPAGSGNGLARHLNIPLVIGQAISIINQGQILNMDTIKVNDIPFLSIAGIGFDAFVAEKFAGNVTRGFRTYFNIVSSEYLYYKPLDYKLMIDGHSETYKALFISFANSDQFGYNTSIAPGARVDDGLMDICVVQKIPLYSIPFVAPLLFIKQVHRSTFVNIVKAKEVVVKTKKTLIVNIDGEPVSLKGPLHFCINPHSLKVIIP
jgi:YegS/Rv2252/BmrU family lipid kinase